MPKLEQTHVARSPSTPTRSVCVSDYSPRACAMSPPCRSMSPRHRPGRSTSWRAPRGSKYEGARSSARCGRGGSWHDKHMRCPPKVKCKSNTFFGRPAVSTASRAMARPYAITLQSASLDSTNILCSYCSASASGRKRLRMCIRPLPHGRGSYWT